MGYLTFIILCGIYVYLNLETWRVLNHKREHRHEDDLITIRDLDELMLVARNKQMAKVITKSSKRAAEVLSDATRDSRFIKEILGIKSLISEPDEKLDKSSSILSKTFSFEMPQTPKKKDD